jgi:DNA-binding transcriptional LysR family regulator
MDRLEAMSIALAVAEAGSLSAAARRLNTPVSTASRKITDLEDHLRAKLFDRTGRSLTLTHAGASYIAGLKRILADLSDVERAAAGEYAHPSGELIVTAPVGLGRLYLLPILTEFLRVYPDVTAHFILSDRNYSVPDEIDVALRVGVLPDSRLMAIRVGPSQRVVCASPAYLAARGTPRTPQDIVAHDCISFDGLQAPNVWVFGRVGNEIPVTVRPRLMVSSVEAACEAAIAGMGLTRGASYHVAAAVAAGTLVTVLDEYRPEPTPVSLVHAGGHRAPAKLRAFLDFAAPRLRARLAG